MPSLLSLSQYHVSPVATTTTSSFSSSSSFSLSFRLTFFTASVLAFIGTSTKHALLTSAAAWFSIWMYSVWRTGTRSLLNGTPSQRTAWAAGGFMALAQMCERAVDRRDIWWAKTLLPLAIDTFVKVGVFEKVPFRADSHPSTPTKPAPIRPYEPSSKLIIATASGLLVTYTAVASIPVVVIGLSYVVLEVLAFQLVERARVYAQHHTPYGSGIIHPVHGLLAQAEHSAVAGTKEQRLAILRDVSAVGAIMTATSALGLESLRFGGISNYGLLDQSMGDHWIAGQGIVSVVYVLGTVLVHAGVLGPMLTMIQHHGAFSTSFVPLSAAVCSQLLLAFSPSRLWFGALCAGTALSFLDEHNAYDTRSRMRPRISRILSLTALLSFVIFVIQCLRQPKQASPTLLVSEPAARIDYSSPSEPLEPLPWINKQIHPLKSLVHDAQESWKTNLASQSQTLEAAVIEYRRRYGIPPPPHFDKWFAFATRKGVQLIDEYDTIYHSLLPFWALSPATLRARTREALGHGDNQLMALLVRNGKAVHVEAGPEWLQQATIGMMESFVEYLPDMDLAFNLHDEPRVVVPHDELSRLVEIALTKSLPEANSHAAPRNTFSDRPNDLTNGQRVYEVKTSRFSHYAHQATWVPSRLSCSPESPARALEDSLAQDNLTAYALSELGFVYNHTAFSDICNSPSLSATHGFFDRPNAFNVVHQLFPIFSQSKMSSFQDILYPSPWYWFGKVEHKENSDMKWSEKENKLWWRGSTTGGFSRAGGWRRQHRQHMVQKLNALDRAKVMTTGEPVTSGGRSRFKWEVNQVERQDFQALIDVHFSHIGQCDPGDCDAQREFFTVVAPADQQEAWKFKYLLDMDGNAFSGRFYAFLTSHSLPFKMALFREWHEEWIKPWIHYIPLSLRADEVLETVRYLDREADGQVLASGLAAEGRDWAEKALRNEDFEAWFFRLLLEYGRVIDDNRSVIGYTGL